MERMRWKLRMPVNVAKSDWRLMKPVDILVRIAGELGELLASFKVYDSNYDEFKEEKVILECADVANFCMMLADRLDKTQA